MPSDAPHKRRPHPILTALGLFANALVVAIGAWAIVSGNVVGGVLIAVLGLYMFAAIVSTTATRYGAKKLATGFGLSVYIFLPAWVITLTVLMFTSGSSAWLDVVGLAASAAALVFGARGLLRWATGPRTSA
jgi:hypothetical protein